MPGSLEPLFSPISQLNHKQVMKNQENQDSHRMVPRKIFNGGVDEYTKKRGQTEFKKCLAALGLDVSRITECFKIISTCESEKFAMMQQIPEGFETWATIGMFIRDKPRVDKMYLRMSLRNSSHNVWSTLKHERFIDGIDESIQRNEQMIRKLKGEDTAPQLPSNTPTVSASPDVLTNKALKRTRKNLFDAFLVAYYNSEQTNTSPGMRMVISHWRGVLDAHRVSLMLDGKHSYTKAIQHGDLFLQILHNEVKPKPVRVPAQPRSTAVKISSGRRRNKED